MNLEKLCSEACDTILKTGEFIREQSFKIHEIKVEEKEKNSLVSFVDKTAERQLVESFEKLLPDSGFITEEDTQDITGKTYEWIIDPLDGTTNFLYGIPAYSISVGLRHEGKLIMGIIYEINRKELFYSFSEGKSFLNGNTIHVSKRKNLAECLLSTGFPYYDYSRMEAYISTFNHFMKSTRGIRRIGSAAVDLAYIACGRFDGFFEYSLHAWDVAAGIVIIQNAGGSVSDFSGGNDCLFGEEMVASNNFIHNELLSVINVSFGHK